MAPLGDYVKLPQMAELATDQVSGERIGDRVTNIAEDVVFLATGDIEDLNP